MISVKFAGKNSRNDLGVIVDSFSIQPPNKKKIKASVPFMNGTYDFSTVGSSGEIVYEERIIKMKFNLICASRGTLYNKYTEVLEWLMANGQSQLIFSDMPDVYYMAEVETAPSFEEVVKKNGILDVTFICEPFKYGLVCEGNPLWDTFNFEIDYMQDTEYTVAGSKTITIYNPGLAIVPLITCSAAMTVVMNGYTISLPAGDTTDYKTILYKGSNNISITGTGTIKFTFKKEML